MSAAGVTLLASRTNEEKPKPQGRARLAMTTRFVRLCA